MTLTDDLHAFALLCDQDQTLFLTRLNLTARISEHLINIQQPHQAPATVLETASFHFQTPYAPITLAPQTLKISAPVIWQVPCIHSFFPAIVLHQLCFLFESLDLIPVSKGTSHTLESHGQNPLLFDADALCSFIYPESSLRKALFEKARQHTLVNGEFDFFYARHLQLFLFEYLAQRLVIFFQLQAMHTHTQTQTLPSLSFDLTL